MFKKKDYLEYFSQVLEMEKHMKKEARRLLKLADDKRAKMLIENLLEDEKRHIKIVNEITEIIKKYGK